MTIVAPDTRTTLVLNRYHEAFTVCTARAALRHMINGRFVGVDATSAMYSWDGRDPDDKTKDPSSINWKEKTISVYPDQPVLRSAPKAGEEVFWYIPTIVRCNKSFGFRVKEGKDISLKMCYKIYKGVCQYCYKHIPFSEATKDHCYPKSKGGSNREFNIVLACKTCNNGKGDIYPYYDKFGNPVTPVVMLPSGVLRPDSPRNEWRSWLMMEEAPAQE